MLNKHTVTTFLSGVSELSVHPIVRKAFYKNQLACFQTKGTSQGATCLFSLIKPTEQLQKGMECDNSLTGMQL